MVSVELAIRNYVLDNVDLRATFVLAEWWGHTTGAVSTGLSLIALRSSSLVSPLSRCQPLTLLSRGARPPSASGGDIRCMIVSFFR